MTIRLGVAGPGARIVPSVAALCLLFGLALGADGDSSSNRPLNHGSGVSADGAGGVGLGGGHKRRLDIGYRHLGCFRRSPTDGEMDMQLEVLPLTLHMCYEHCLSERSSYFATQKGSQCWCSLESSSPHFDYSSGGVGVCDAWCGGDASTTCGGWDGSSRDFYAIDPVPRAAPGLTTVGEEEGGGASGNSGPLERLLHLHNAARCMHATGPLTFADPVAVTAEAYADVLASEENCGSAEASHSTLLGENVFVCASSDGQQRGRDPDGPSCFSPEGAMEAFYESQVGSGPPPTYGTQATQVLWKSTSQMGCALRACEKGGLKYDILVCRYSPPAGEDTTGTEVGFEANSKSKCGYD